MSSRIAGRTILASASVTLLLACSHAVAQSVDSQTTQTPAQQITAVSRSALQAASKRDTAELDRSLNSLLSIADINHLGGDPSFVKAIVMIAFAASDPE